MEVKNEQEIHQINGKLRKELMLHTSDDVEFYSSVKYTDEEYLIDSNSSHRSSICSSISENRLFFHINCCRILERMYPETIIWIN